MPALSARELRVAYGDAVVVPELSLELKPGVITAIVGPNGSGKSTALRTMARLQRPTSGGVYLDGRDIAALKTRDIARELAILPQAPEIPSGVTVWDLVGYGRYPYQGLLGSLKEADYAAMEWAVEMTGLQTLRERAVDTLSGGERQRAWIAMALAQQTGILLLDEPTTFLDIRYQIDVLALVRTLNRTRGITVGWVLHDLNQAAAYSDHLIMLRGGEIYAEGAPEDVMNARTILEVFGIEVEVILDPRNRCPTCLLYGAREFARS